jgi:hypothetical protein
VGAGLPARPLPTRPTPNDGPPSLLTALGKPAIVLGGRHQGSGEASFELGLCMGAWRPAVGFDCRLQRYAFPFVASILARILAWRWRRIPHNADCRGNSSSHADASTGDTRSDPGGSNARPHLRQCASVGPTWTGDHSHREDVTEYGVLDPGRVQVGAVHSPGPGAKDLRWGRQCFLDVDRRKPNDARSMADLRDVWHCQ